MTISIVDHELPDDTHNLYDVTFFNDEIHTLVTRSPSMVDSWISDVENLHRHMLHRLIVGLDVEWRPSFSRSIENPVAIIQLCVARKCLIYQLIHSPGAPQSLVDFLRKANYTFVGVGIDSDVEKLLGDYGFGVSNAVDLRVLAADGLGMKELRNSGIKNLAKEVLGREIEKPKRVTMSRWDNEWLTPAQVQYACVDAFLSYEIGKTLNALARWV
ncbi:hypothetical protein L1049_009003 [Liquidambar formosana]|uniref:3'-5' exonuclease domain-containing protein n=1 Tax=Liquidambar formosana TaxID=63359 RepID=A0AAP0SAK3_LIQFO